ncbi:Amino acid adenylation domain-containing protein/thioester reductase domain-containing protein [Gammaproteobacteria bacterium]
MTNNQNNSLCIHQLFEEQVNRTPEVIAIIDENRQFTYQKLNGLANQLAHFLKKCGVKADTPVGLYLENSLDLVVGILGILKAGGGYVPLDITYPLERISYMLKDSGSVLLLTQSYLIEKLSTNNLSVFCLDTYRDQIAQESHENHTKVTEPENLAYIIYTSGSSGQPKGIAMPHSALVNLIQWQNRIASIPRTAKTLQFTPISFDVSFQEIFSTLCSGGTLVIMPIAARRDPKVLLHCLMEQEIERLFLPPVALHQLSMTAIDLEITPFHLREVITAGDQLQITPTVINFFSNLHHCSLHNHYGPSETHVVTAFTLHGSSSTWPKLPPIGQPIDNNQILLLDETLQQVPLGNCGELYIGGVGLARGYINRPELTAARFIRNPYSPGRLYKTGDLARWLPDGNLEFLGRSDHQIKIRGFRVELGEIETLLSSHALVKEAVVVPYEDSIQNKRLVAYIVPKPVASLKKTSSTHLEQIHTWQRIWDEAYRVSTRQWEETFHLGGWNDSYTGASLPEVQVREWVSRTVERIMSLLPKRVLEIGCGTGLLLFRIAPQCEHYYGTDISAEGLKYIQQQIDSTALQERVSLQQVAAEAIDTIPMAPVDTIIINGVIQFFPGMDYFIAVLEKVLRLIQPGGQIFIGDVQSYSLMELFHTSVQLYQATDSLSTDDLKKRIKERMAEEKKLLFSPIFFATLPQYFPQISHLEIQLKRGHYQNELTRFRYDVTLHIAKPLIMPATPLVWSAWQADQFTPTTVRQRLTEYAPEFFGITGVPNARLWRDTQAMTSLADTPVTVRELKNMLQLGGIEPEQWWSLASELPYQVYLCWSQEDHLANYDVLFQRRDSVATMTATLFPALQTASTSIKSWSVYANDPLQSKEAIGPKLRHFLKEKLPDYMVPATFIFLDEFPLTPSGKLDRRLLPVPKLQRPVLDRPYAAPITATEEKLVEIWAGILNIQPIGRDDNFFDLGGHSLLIMQLLSQVREIFQVDLPLASLFEYPTVAQWGQVIKKQQQGGQIMNTLTALTVGELQQYVSPPADIWGNKHSTAPMIESPKRILLTGVTGFIGAFLLNELLHQTEADIYCLIRGCKTITKAKERIYQNLRRYGLNEFVSDETLNPRIIPVKGDLTQLRLGLNESEFDILAEEIDIIYHLGAEVNLLYPYMALQATNVWGTQEILRLAGCHKIKPVHYASTIGIFESPAYVGYPAILEQHDLKIEDTIYGGYAQSKWVAEQLLLMAQSHGIPITIYRPGAVLGHSQTGVMDTDHIVIVLLRYFLQHHSVPRLEMLIDMTPIDFVSRAMVHLSMQTDNSGKIFHLVNPKPLTFIQLVETLAEIGYHLELIEYSQWLSTMRQMNIDSPDNLFGALLPLFTGDMPKTYLSYLEMSSIGMKFDYRNVTQGLADSGIYCPPQDSQLLNTYLKYLKSRYQVVL